MHRILAIALVAYAILGCGKLGGSGNRSPVPASSAIAAQPAEPSPKVRIANPARAAFLSVGPAAVEGTAFGVDGAPVPTVRVNGVTLPTDAQGRFSTTVNLVNGLNAIEASCTDRTGRLGGTAVGVIAGDYKPLNQKIRQALVARITDPTLDAAGKIGEAALWTQDWSGIFMGLNPLFNTSFIGIGVSVDVQQVRFRDLEVRADSRTGKLAATINVHEPIFDVTINANVWGIPIGPEPAVARADVFQVVADAGFNALPDGSIDFWTANPAVTFQNFGLTVQNGLLDAIVQLAAKTAIENAVKNYVIGAISTDLPPFLDTALTDYVGGGHPFDLLGKQFSFEFLAEQIAFDGTGLSLSTGFDARTREPLTARAAAAPGSFYTPGATPAMPAGRGFAVTVDDDGVNRLLHALWSGGHFDFNVDQALLDAEGLNFPIRLEVGSLRRFMPELGGVFPDAAPLRLKTEACLPPIVRITGAPDLIEAQAGEFALEIWVDRASNGTFEKLLRAVVHIEMGMGVALNATDGLKLSSLGQPRLRFDVIEEPMIELDDRRLEVLLDILFTPTLPSALNKLKPITIPHLHQLTTLNVGAHADGPSREHLTIEGDAVR